MNHPRHPARTQLWLLAGAAAIGLALYLSIPGSLTYVLVGLFVLLHLVMHAGHNHGAHDHNQHDPGPADAPTTHDPGRDAHTHDAHTHDVPAPKRAGAAPLATVPVTTPAPERAASPHTADDRHGRRLP